MFVEEIVDKYTAQNGRCALLIPASILTDKTCSGLEKEKRQAIRKHNPARLPFLHKNRESPYIKGILTKKETLTFYQNKRSFMIAEAGFEPAVLHFHCGENAAVGSAALTVHRTVIHSRLTLRFIRPRAHNPKILTVTIPLHR